MEPAILRIKNDLKEIRFGNCINTIGYAVQKEGYPFIVEACIIGPRSTRYEDELLIFEFRFSNNYPFAPPTVTFISETNHPYILLIEQLMSSVLQNEWKPIITIKEILYGILGILHSVDIISNIFK